MSEINIKELRKKLGVSQEKLAELLGVHHRTIQNYETGGVVPKAKYALLCKLMEKADAQQDNDSSNDEPILREPTYYGGEDPEESNTRLIPFYDDVVSIGGNNDRVANMDGISEPTDYIDTGDWFRDATAAIRHYGESMVEYPNGCILALKEVLDRELIVPGRDYMIETSEYRVTKRVQLGKTKEYITAYSTNEEKYSDGRLVHEPFDIPLRAITHISLVLGYVVKKNGGTLVYSSNKKK